MNEKSYIIVYQGEIEIVIQNLQENGIDKFIILNNTILVIYVEFDFDESILNKIISVAWWQRSVPMSSLIQITNNLSEGESTTSASGTGYIYNNPYLNITGKNILIAIIDSGIDYLHPDFLDEDNNSVILSIWDQESTTKEAPEGLLFGSEFSRDEINTAINNNDNSLTIDRLGTGTIAAGIALGRGNLNKNYKGVAIDSELVVVKLRSYEGTYIEGAINYQKSDFLAGIKYVLDVAKKENKDIIINLTLALQAKSIVELTMLDTFSDLTTSGKIVVSGAGNEGNTDIHYEGRLKSLNDSQDLVIQVGKQKNLDIDIVTSGPDKIKASLISPSGELSYELIYTPDMPVYNGKFNLENTSYEMRVIYPWLESGNLQIKIGLKDIKPGAWTLRLRPEFIIQGNYDVYLPNKSIISPQTRFSDPNSGSTITMYATTENVITTGTYNDKTDSIWIGSSKGPVKTIEIKPDILAPGVDIISTYINSTYNTATGTGVSSSLVSGVLAIMMQYIKEESPEYRGYLFTQQLKTYLMLGATKKDIYTYPNISQGYGNLNLKETIIAISNNF